MNWKVAKVPAEEWQQKFSAESHRLVFGTIKPKHRDRIDYALLVIRDEAPVGYVTVKEYDCETVYWQFGGVFPRLRRSMTAVRAIEEALEWQKKHSRRILTYVENKNLPMLRFYLGYGFLIIGTRTYNNMVMVDLVKELHGNG